MISSVLALSKKILVLSHKNPDGDAIGSTLGLGLSLAALGKTVHMVNVNPVPDSLKWLPQSGAIMQKPDATANYDTVVMLDCNELERTGFAPHDIGSPENFVVIDHHPGKAEFFTQLIDIKAAATGQLVYDILLAMGAPLDGDIATAIYVALHTDTGGFRFSNTNADVFILAAHLCSHGAEPYYVAQMLMDQEKPQRVKLLGLALSTLAFSADGRIASLYLTREMFEEAGASDQDTDGFASYPRSVKGVDVGYLVREAEGGLVRITLRSRGLVDVSAVARALGGGGHKNAAGATVAGTVREAMKMVEELLEAGLKKC